MNQSVATGDVRVSEALDLFLTIGGLEGKTRNTLRWYRYVVSALMRRLGDVPVGEVTTDRLRAYLLQRKAAISETSLAGHVRGLRAFFRFLAREGILAEHPMTRIPVPKLPRQFPRTYTPEQIKRLFRAIDRKSVYGHRTYVMLVLVLDTGMRSGECCRVRYGDLDLAARTVTVMGKGRKARTIPFSPATATLLRGWIGRLGIAEPHRFLFPSRRGQSYAPINPDSFWESVRKAAKKADVRVAAAVHTLRHTFATNWIARGGDVLSLRQILGHERLETVAIYAHMNVEQLRDRHDALQPLKVIAR